MNSENDYQDDKKLVFALIKFKELLNKLDNESPIISYTDIYEIGNIWIDINFKYLYLIPDSFNRNDKHKMIMYHMLISEILDSLHSVKKIHDINKMRSIVIMLKEWLLYFENKEEMEGGNYDH